MRRLCLLALLAAACAEPPQAGVVVLSVEPSSAASRAGLTNGDVVVGWSQGSAAIDMGGPVESPLEVLLLETERSPHGSITLDVVRGRKRLRITCATGEWGIESRPMLRRAQAARSREAERLHVAGDPVLAAEIWSALAAAASDQGRFDQAAWFHIQEGISSIRAQEPEGAAVAFENARAEIVQRVADGGFDATALRAAVYDLEGRALDDAGRYADSLAAHRQSLELRRELAPDSASVAWTLVEISRASYSIRDMAGARAAQAGVEIYRSFPSAQVELSRALNLQANFVDATGNFDRAEALYREALAILEAVAPGGKGTARLANNLGMIAHDRGRLHEAEVLYRQALAIGQRLDPTAANTAGTLNVLGILAKDRGDFPGARLYYEKALAIFREVRSDGIEVAGMLNNLGNLSLRLGDIHSAELYHREALELRKKLQPDGLDVASSLHNVGRVLRRAGKLEEAASHLERALEAKERLVPGTVIFSNTLIELGEVARQTGELDRAADFIEQALLIRRGVAPDSADVAEGLFNLGAVAYERGRGTQAERHWREAIDIVERQRGRQHLFPEDSYRFAAPYHGYYHDLARLLYETGRERESFELLESSRARALRVMMRQKGELRTAEVPVELAAERYRLESSLDRADSRRARISQAEPEQAGRYRARVAELRLALDDVSARIRQAAPRLAEFSEPELLDLDQVRRALDIGTLLLSYSVGDDSTLLFVVPAQHETVEDLVIHVLPVGEEELRRRVQIFRALIKRGKEHPEIEAALVTQGHRLFQRLVEPVAEAIAGIDRVLIVADGPLLALPFGALVRRPQPLEFFAGWKPLAYSASAAVFAQTKASRSPPSANPRFVGFANPGLGAGVNRSRWPPLPHAGRELESIAGLFDGRAEIFLGGEATERQAKARSVSADYLHFATHAFLDRRFPLESALVLAFPEDGDETAESGILRAWEVIAEMRTDADLVTLSACETALGGELAGEGLIGLARAFQYAGARSLLVSQWAVSDLSTSELMVRFYRKLRAGVAKSEALQVAQRELISAPIVRDTGESIDARHPFHWAAFQVIGDWR